MAEVLSRSLTLYVGTANPPTTKVAEVSKYKASRKNVKANTTTYDNPNGAESHSVTGSNFSGSFEMRYETADAGQAIVIDAARNGTKLWVAVRNRGDGAGLPQQLFQATFEVEDAQGDQSVVILPVSFERSGDTNYSNQV